MPTFRVHCRRAGFSQGLQLAKKLKPNCLGFGQCRGKQRSSAKRALVWSVVKADKLKSNLWMLGVSFSFSGKSGCC